MIPDAAVKAAIEVRYDHGTDPMPYHSNRCRCGATFATAVLQLEHVVRRELEAALKHIPGEPTHADNLQSELDRMERPGDGS